MTMTAAFQSEFGRWKTSPAIPSTSYALGWYTLIWQMFTFLTEVLSWFHTLLELILEWFFGWKSYINIFPVVLSLVYVLTPQCNTLNKSSCTYRPRWWFWRLCVWRLAVPEVIWEWGFRICKSCRRWRFCRGIVGAKRPKKFITVSWPNKVTFTKIWAHFTIVSGTCGIRGFLAISKLEGPCLLNWGAGGAV